MPRNHHPMMNRRRARSLLTRSLVLLGGACALFLEGTAAAEEVGEAPVVKNSVLLDKVFSPVRVGFALLTHGNRQYVAYYNAERRTVVAQRDLPDGEFAKKVLSSESDKPPRQSKGRTSTVQGWDSHNYLTLAVDSEGYIHLAGNMHVSPLTYYRSTEPGDILTMEQVKKMTGKREKRCTYPHFRTAPDGRMLFHYRDGWSGNGIEIYNVYDAKAKTWSRYFEESLISGEGKCNAYQRGPSLGPDGYYHLLWMWRETHHAETNHDLSYARSKDLLNWETAGGEKLDLPITPADTKTIIDPVPVKGGMLNTAHRFAFDSKDRVVVSYYKFDDDGNTQAYAARFEDGTWKISQISDWKHAHIFKGGGTGPSSFGTSLWIGRIQQHGEGKLALPYRHWKHGNAMLVFDEETLAPLGTAPTPKKAVKFPLELTKVQSDFPGMSVRWRGDSGESPDPSVKYYLRWESLGSNRDRPRDKPWPGNSDLTVVKLSVE